MNSTPVSSVRPATGAKDPIVREPAVATKAAPSAGSVQPSRSSDAAEPPVDVERVQEIRQAIADGSYRLDPGRTAEAVIASGASLRRPT